MTIPPPSHPAASETTQVFSAIEAVTIYATLVRARMVQTEVLELTPMTTTQRDALLNVSNGLLIYNSTDNKFQGYENGAWTNLI